MRHGLTHMPLPGLIVTLVVLAAAPAPAPAGAATTFSGFEGAGLDGWTPRAIDIDDPPVPWSVARSADRAFEGQGSAKFDVDNVNDAAKVWLERDFDVTPGRRYTVAVSYQFATRDLPIGSWQLITFARDDAPQTAEDLHFIGDTWKGDESDEPIYLWLPKSYTTELTSADGRLHVGVGVWGTFETPRQYYVDNLRVEITEVPLPAAGPLAAVGLGGLALCRARRDLQPRLGSKR